MTSLSAEFLITALIVVLIPGTGVIYTISIGIANGARASVAAALGCTLGIVPHLLASVFGLAAILHASALAFQLLKYLGVAYLLYLAWGLWRSAKPLALDALPQPGQAQARRNRLWHIALRGIFINILNPKLSVFFLAFLPQFIPPGAADMMARMSVMSSVFMALTLGVFVVYGLAANYLSQRLLSSARLQQSLQRAFAATFAAFAVKLALSER